MPNTRPTTSATHHSPASSVRDLRTGGRAVFLPLPSLGALPSPTAHSAPAATLHSRTPGGRWGGRRAGSGALAWPSLCALLWVSLPPDSCHELPLPGVLPVVQSSGVQSVAISAYEMILSPQVDLFPKTASAAAIRYAFALPGLCMPWHQSSKQNAVSRITVDGGVEGSI